MVNHDLKPLTALGNDAAEVITLGPYTFTERFDVALASVATRRGRDKDLAKAAKAAGVPLAAPARFAAGTPYSAFWVAPDMWFVEAPFATHEDLAKHLKTALGEAASITNRPTHGCGLTFQRPICRRFWNASRTLIWPACPSAMPAGPSSSILALT